MLKIANSKQLSARPEGHDYAAEIKQRIGSKPAMLHMDGMYATAERRRPYMLAEGVAIIDICGYLSNEPYWWDETGYPDLCAEVTQALNDAAVKGILLRVDSPGGDTDGAFEAAVFLAESAKKKPIWAVADGAAYSAAYLLASQAAKVYAPPVTGGIGSIGVYMMHVDFSENLKQSGVAVTFIKAGEGKTAGNSYEPLSPEIKAQYQLEVDRLYGEFVAAVATGRAMKESAVVKLGAWLYSGKDAVLSSKLADEVGTLEDAWSALALSVADDKKTFPGTAASAATGKTSSAKAEATTATPAAEFKKEVPMEPQLPAGAANPTDTVSQQDHERLLTEARTAATTDGKATAVADFDQIVALCQLAGKPTAALGYIKARKNPTEVAALLVTEKAEADAANEVTNRTDLSAGGKSQGLDFGSLVIAGCEKLAAGMTAQRKGA